MQRISLFKASRSLMSTEPQKKLLNWQEFFQLRRKLQIFQRAAGFPFVFGFLTAESAILSLPIFDPTRMMFGMDPLVMVGLSSLIGSIGSYFVGVTLSGFFWRKLRPELSEQLNIKQKDFYSRITKYRANVPPNPTQMNFSFDYYGEKVRSVEDYRKWLRRQNKMKLGRTFSLNLDNKN